LKKKILFSKICVINWKKYAHFETYVLDTMCAGDKFLKHW